MRDRRPLYVLLAIAALVGLFVVVRPEDDAGGAGNTTRVTPPTAEPAPAQTAPAGTTPTQTTKPKVTRWLVDSRDEKLDRLTVPKGTPVRIVVIADVTDHVHVHGYDLMSDVAPGSPAVVSFTAKLAGRFEIELEDRSRQIAQLTVQP